MTLTANFAAIPDSRHAEEIERLCGAMEAADKAGCYPRLKVERPWSTVTPCLRSGDYLVKIVEEKTTAIIFTQPGRSSWSRFTQNWAI
jgi:hypothetical protein